MASLVYDKASSMNDTPFPRVLVVAMGRINAADTSNNGLLLRNLFGGWPKSHTAQIYSGSDNGDEGFFGRYYLLRKEDRRLGWLYYRLKAEAQHTVSGAPTGEEACVPMSSRWATRVRIIGKRWLIDTGLHELLFKVRLSAELRAWVDEFKPDIVFAQGYNLAFTRIPLLIADYCRAPIAYYPTDDWSDSLYDPRTSPARVLSCWARRAELSESRRLVDHAAIRLAFNPYMRDEFRTRYSKEFTVLMHGDDAERFRRTSPTRAAADARPLIVCTGDFDKYRWTLLEDMDVACEILTQRGFNPWVMAYPVNLSSLMAERCATFHHVRLAPCPKHEELVSVILGADILFLPERFGPEVWDIRFSVSSKAHLFMFSGRPIVVYSDSATGITRYAREEKWAAVVEQRDPLLLADVLERLITDQTERQRLIADGSRVAMKNHHLPSIQSAFHDLVCSAVQTNPFDNKPV